MRYLLDFLAQIGDIRTLPVVRALLENSQSHLQTCDRRAQLVGDIPEKPFLTGDKIREAPREPIDRAAEATEFVAALFTYVHVKLAVGDALRGLTHLANRTRDPMDKWKPE